MKKVIIALAVLIAAVFTSNAQVFIGGGVGMDLSGGKYKSGSNSTDKPTVLSVEVTPKVGFFLNDDFAVGLQAGIISETRKWNSGSQDNKNSFFGWGVLGFARYNAIGGDKLSLLLEGSVGLRGGKMKYKRGSATTEDNPELSFGINLLPVLSYSLTDRLNIEVNCEFLRLGFGYSVITDSDDSNNKSTSTSFGFGANTGSDEFFTSPILNIGLIYKF